jgi:ADP-heptose:LPS heptosyltransferase
MEILFVKFGALGDVVNTLPLAVCLHRRLNARIHWLVEPLSFPIVSGHSSVRRAILFDRRRWRTAAPQVIGRLRDRPFDVVLDLQRTLKSGGFAMAAKAARRIGFDRRRCKEMTWLLPFERIPPANPASHMVHQYLEFAAYLGVHRPDIEWGIDCGQAPPATLPPRYAVLNIGATKPANRWPGRNWSALAGQLWERLQMPCVLTGGREDMPLADRILAPAPRSLRNLVGQTAISQLVSVLKNASVVITCDTGPMHLAVALKTPVVALFGPSDPRRTGPFRGRVVRAAVDCAPCNRRTCPEPICMQQIETGSVLAQVEAALR